MAIPTIGEEAPKMCKPSIFRSALDNLTPGNFCIAVTVLLNIFLYIRLFWKLEFLTSFDFVALCLATLMNALMHLYIFFVAFRRFLFDWHRLKRMGVLGVLHTIANLAAIVMSYYFMAFDWIPSLELQNSTRTMMCQAWPICVLLSAAGSASLLWFVPKVSKSLSRFFACATITTAMYGLSGLYYNFPYEHLKFLLVLTGLAGTIFNTINFIDVYSSFVLLHFDREFPKTILPMPTKAKRAKRSSAYTYSTGKRFFWRSFRKCDFMLYLVPEKDESGFQKRKSFVIQTDHPVMKPSIAWLVYTLGETASAITFVFATLGLIDDSDPVAFSLVFNFYASVTFSVTLALKGTVTHQQFGTILAYNLLSTSFLNQYQAGKGSCQTFFWVVLGEAVFGAAVMAATYFVSEQKVDLKEF